MNLFKKLFTILGVLLITSLAKADQSAVSIINELLRGELAAVETYRQALDKFGAGTNSADLRKFYDQHQDAVSQLKQQVIKLGETPATSAGPWGAWAKAVEGSAKVFGETAALKVLKEGEEHGVKEYQELLDNKNAPAEVKELVRSSLLPQLEQHIAVLDKIISKS